MSKKIIRGDPYVSKKILFENEQKIFLLLLNFAYLRYSKHYNTKILEKILKTAPWPKVG